MKVALLRIISFAILWTVFPTAQPVHAGEFRDSWASLSICFGVPITGMLRDPANSQKFDYSGLGTSWNDGIASLTFGWTPLQLSESIKLGLSVRGSVALCLAGNGTVDVYQTIPLTNVKIRTGRADCGFYIGALTAVSPMVVARFLLRPGSYLNFGAGPTVWKYLAMAYKGRDYDDNLLDGAIGASIAVVGQLSIEWFYLEAGVSGPDGFFGLGFSI